MNNLIGITQRVDFINDYNEKRDCLDTNWYKFLDKIGLTPLPLPNVNSKIANKLFANIKFKGLILSGGNTLYSCSPYDKNASLIRDKFEFHLIDYALKKNIPLIGICRGMQIINKYFNGKVIRIKDGKNSHQLKQLDSQFILPTKVNSFHDWGINSDGLSDELKAIALDSDDNIEAFVHVQKKIVGIMWHPERGRTFNKKNIEIFKKVFL
tara:strand:- start:2052 stop:2681 length:630 start_codon:yes stop_codon:yes gene_type:complete